MSECMCMIAKPQVSLTAPNHDHFAQVSLTVFWMQLPKLKNLICESIAQNLMPVSLTKSF